jgi:UDP-N-acetylmuramoyl-L-alanyl-D-glutamate--2,6-diaminopimelate ligase
LKLKDILPELTVQEFTGDRNAEITGVAYDSRQVEDGGLFVAVRGYRSDGHDFLAEAVRRGAAAVVVEETSPAAGSDGKTTACFLLEGALRAAGRETALATTVHNALAGEARPARLTTAEAPEVQAFLREAVAAGASHAVVEVSSHALALSRVADVEFAAAAFTNLSHDHLDLHGDLEQYFSAKASLFDQRREEAPAVVNVDDPYGRKLHASLQGRVVGYGAAAEADYRLADVAADWEGLTFTATGPEGEAVQVTSGLVGAFNASNCLAAFALARELGVAADVAARGLAQAPPVPGRLEVVPLAAGGRVVIDYAHSPDSMEKALAEIRRLGGGRLVVVFGCTGDRDRGKRPVMAEVARRYGDYVVLTSDDPYYEDPEAIAREAELGLERAGAVSPDDYRVILDREEAIRFALAAAGEAPPTVVAILGKGHEEVQKIQGRTVPCHDRAIVEYALAELGVRGNARAASQP